MVIQQRSTSSVPGGAANVAMNIEALGAKCDLIAITGNDSDGHILRKVLKDRGIDPGGLISDPDRPTTTKTRIVANHGHQVIRLDHESDAPISTDLQAEIYLKLEAAIGKVDFVLLSDYAKGCVSERIAQEVIQMSARFGKRVIANPKPSTVKWYRGAYLLSLNQFEAAVTLGIPEITIENAIESAMKLREMLEVNAMVVTLRADGMAGCWDGGLALIPAVRVEVYDESGAGDTAIATLALCAGASTDNGEGLGESALKLATRTAACVVAKAGVCVPTSHDLELIGASSDPC